MADIFNKDCNITPVKALKQHWTQVKFSYMENPRPNYGIMLLLNGQIDFITSSEKLCAKAGNIIFLPKGSYYEARFCTELGEIDNYLINFEADEDISDCVKPEIILENASFSCADLFGQFIEENYNMESTQLRSKGLLCLLLDTILSEKVNRSSRFNRVLVKAKNLLQKSEDIPISQIARECSVSESGLRKIFKDNIGVSPTQYRLSVKISKAKYLLESTDMSVGEISDKLNFFDAAYFCRIFSKQTGVTPKKYSEQKKL